MGERSTFDVSDYLDDDEVMVEYLSACFEDQNPALFLSALADVAKAKGMAHLAETTGLGPESLGKALALGAYPRLEIIRKVVAALRLKMTVAPITAE